MRHILTHTRHNTSCAPSAGITPIRLHRSYLSQDAPCVQAPGTAYIVSNFLPVYQSLRVRVDADGCDCTLLNPLTDINRIRCLVPTWSPASPRPAPNIKFRLFMPFLVSVVLGRCCQSLRASPIRGTAPRGGRSPRRTSSSSCRTGSPRPRRCTTRRRSPA